MSFTIFLNDKLRQNKIDEKVYGPYIIGILEGSDETLEEKRDAVEDLISELIEKDIAKFVDEIFERWTNSQPAEEKKQDGIVFDIDEQLAMLLESKKITIQERTLTEEEKRIKQQILANYSQCSDKEEDDDESDDDEREESSDPNLQKNTNKSDVQQLQKEKREQAKMESAAKKEKDKDDRNKQKKSREEKKEKRKTVKGERKR